MKKTLIFLLLTFFFTCLIFIFKSYFLFDIRPQIEEKYIEPTIMIPDEWEQKDIEMKAWDIEKKAILHENREKNIIKTHLLATSKVTFSYVPEDFRYKASQYSWLLWLFLNHSLIQSQIKKLNVEMYENLLDVRWKMKNKTLKLFWVLLMDEWEFMSVSIHEFAHYVDLYFLEKKVLTDISNYYYDLSWESTKILKANQKQVDFVSGYAMTNKYEDFAESFTYYILHNEDFLRKSQESLILKQKYDFFWRYLFRNNEFQSSNFSKWNEIKKYYRDITKIEINLKNLLQYLKNWITSPITKQ